MPDFLVHDHGSIFFRAISCRGRRWINDHVGDDGQEWAGVVIVDVIRGARADGLRVRW
jgi:hypothetical protein